MMDKTNSSDFKTSPEFIPTCREGKLRGILFLLLFPCLLMAQGRFSADAIPVTADGVVFSTDCTGLPGTAEDIRAQVLMYLSTRLDAVKGRIVVDNDSMVVCDVVDALVYKKQALAVYAMYMRYRLECDYADGRCRVSFRDISFMEKEDYELSTGQRRPDSRGSLTPTVYSATEIMVDKKYKTLFVKGASDQITACVIDRMNEVVKEIVAPLQP